MKNVINIIPEVVSIFSTLSRTKGLVEMIANHEKLFEASHLVDQSRSHRFTQVIKTKVLNYNPR